MKWANLLLPILALDTPPPGTWDTIRVLLWIVISAGAVIGVLVGYKKLRATDEPKRRLLPDPLRTEEVEKFVTVPAWTDKNKARDVELKDMEQRIEKKIDIHEKLVRNRLHELSNQVNGIAVEAKEGREVATEQFQKIEGQLGELRSTSVHTNALAIRTDHAVREIPEKIAAAVARNRR